MPRRLQLADQVRGLCSCGRPQMKGPSTRLGFIRYISICSGCAKKKYKKPITPRIRPYRKHKKKYCNRCGFIAVHPCQLDVHHIDHNHDNNTPSNLETLCANCHRLEHAPKEKAPAT